MIRPQLLQAQSYRPTLKFLARNLAAVPPAPARFAAMAASSSPDIQRVNAFWFDRNPMEWFVPPPGFDDEVKAGFGDLVVRARTTAELDGWAAEPDGAVALVVLLDQLTRNVFRGSADAFSGDAKASAVAVRAVARGLDRALPPVRAIALYMPLMHGETLLSQVAAVALLERLKTRCAAAGGDDAAILPFVEKGLQAAQGHMDVIGRFGRYPSRNAILGRQNTEEEEAFLKETPGGLSGPPPK